MESKIFRKPQKFLGPSQFATVLNLSHFQTPQELKNRIENGMWQTISPAATFGINHEAQALKHYQEVTGFNVTKAKWKTHHHNTRLGGIADGLVIDSESGKISHGVEIKCHPQKTSPLTIIPKYYLTQIAGYLDLYQADQWDFVSVAFNGTDEIYDINIIRITLDEIKDIWNNDWYPKLCQFTDSINWAT